LGSVVRGYTSGLVERIQGGTQIKIHMAVTLGTERRIKENTDREKKNEPGGGRWIVIPLHS
jgi:hypothetical protein